MKRIVFVKALAFLCVIALFVSCKKDSPDPESKAKTKMEIITASSWKYSKMEGKNSGVWTNQSISTCDADDRITFKTTGKAEKTFGTSCPDPVEIVNWSFTSNETKIVIDGDTFELTTLTETTLFITGSDYRVTFSH